MVRSTGREDAVSIHAPARGATPALVDGDVIDECGCFNPRPRTGATLNHSEGSNPCLFQSTPPHGVRRRPTTTRRPARSFNPRPRTGGDRRPHAHPAVQIQPCFNPRPRTGGDPSPSCTTAATGCHRGFNPRPRPGGDSPVHIAGRPCVGMAVSIHAPARGATAIRAHGGAKSPTDVEFQSTPPHGGRPKLRMGAVAPMRHRFNPRPRTGGDRDALTTCKTIRKRTFCANFGPKPRNSRCLAHYLKRFPCRPANLRGARTP